MSTSRDRETRRRQNREAQRRRRSRLKRESEARAAVGGEVAPLSPGLLSRPLKPPETEHDAFIDAAIPRLARKGLLMALAPTATAFEVRQGAVAALEAQRAWDARAERRAARLQEMVELMRPLIMAVSRVLVEMVPESDRARAQRMLEAAVPADLRAALAARAPNAG